MELHSELSLRPQWRRTCLDLCLLPTGCCFEPFLPVVEGAVSEQLVSSLGIRSSPMGPGVVGCYCPIDLIGRREGSDWKPAA